MKKRAVTTMHHKKENHSERKEALFRVIVVLICGLFMYFWSMLAMVLTILNWLFALLLGERNRWIADFLEIYNTFVYVTFRYLTGVTNERPFPFTSLKRMHEFQE